MLYINYINHKTSSLKWPSIFHLHGPPHQLLAEPLAVAGTQGWGGGLNHQAIRLLGAEVIGAYAYGYSY